MIAGPEHVALEQVEPPRAALLDEGGVGHALGDEHGPVRDAPSCTSAAPWRSTSRQSIFTKSAYGIIATWSGAAEKSSIAIRYPRARNRCRPASTSSSATTDSTTSSTSRPACAGSGRSSTRNERVTLTKANEVAAGGPSPKSTSSTDAVATSWRSERQRSTCAGSPSRDR